jgi:hypothetical protein
MDTSGSTHEGWIALIPLGALIFIVIVVLGGPAAFIRTVSTWGSDLYSYTAGVIKNL